MPRASPLRAAPPPSAAGMKKELKELHGHAAAARSASRNSFAMWNTSRWPPEIFTLSRGQTEVTVPGP